MQQRNRSARPSVEGRPPGSDRSAIRLTAVWLTSLFILALPLFGQQFTVETVATTGQLAPGAGGATFARFGQVSTSDSGAVAFNALLTGGANAGGVFLFSGASQSAIALVGQQVPGDPSARFSSFSSPAINNNGDIVFQAGIAGAGSSSGMFLYSGGRLSTVALEGSAAAGSGIRLLGFIDHALNDSGAVVFSARIATRDFGNTSGIFLYASGIISAIALPGQRVGGRVLTMLESPSVDNAGTVVFLDNSFIGPRRLAAGMGIFAFSQGRLSVVETASFPPSSRDVVGSPSIGRTGDIGFVRRSGTDRTFVEKLTVLSGGSPSVPVSSSQASPVAGMVFDHISDAVVNDQGDAAFVGVVGREATLPSTRIQRRGIFLFSGGAVTALELGGETVRGTLPAGPIVVSRPSLSSRWLVFVKSTAATVSTIHRVRVRP